VKKRKCLLDYIIGGGKKKAEGGRLKVEGNYDLMIYDYMISATLYILFGGKK